MPHKLPELPYATDALEPHISRETLETHHGKHHAKYVSKLNELIEDTEFQSMALEDIVRKADGAIFNNAGQAWNHNFYWNSLSPNGGGEPSGSLAQAIEQTFGSYDNFKQEFTRAAKQLFGSGWCWLVKNDDDSLSIERTANADTPLKHGRQALLACDVWEHAYYIDYRNERGKYLEAFWRLANWRRADQLYTGESAARRSAEERRPSARA